METFVLIALFVFGDDNEVFARGPFRTEEHCLKTVHLLLNADIDRDIYMGRCMTFEDYRRYYSHLPLGDRGT